MKPFKSYTKRFHSWQLNPTSYKYPGKKHRCDCCGEEHEGNFCPLCGQKATQGPITWKSVWTGMMEIWGLHSRSMPYTAWQLLTRPGYLMRDYITGMRQVSFPPVKMLVILGVIVYLLGHWLQPQNYSHEMEEVTSTGLLYYFEYASNWLDVHREWYLLVLYSMFILPTWWVFRYAPMIQRHTLPQGFFIQVFIVNQMMVVELLLFLLMLFIPNTKPIKVFLFIFYWIIDYKQLFGYKWWSTIWRWVMMFVMIGVASLIVFGVLSFIKARIDPIPAMEKYGAAFHYTLLSVSLVFLVLLYVLFYSINTINRKAWRERGKWKAWRVPIIISGILLVFFIAITVITEI